jgi:hypothetical protein
LAFGISPYLLNNISEGIKRAKRCHTIAQETTIRPALSYKEMKAVAEKYGLSLDDLQLQAGIMPDSAQAFLCKQWMADYFDRVGDKIPNSDNEVPRS